jgi:hypothetical protein
VRWPGEGRRVQSGCAISQWCSKGSTTRPCRNPYGWSATANISGAPAAGARPCEASASATCIDIYGCSTNRLSTGRAEAGCFGRHANVLFVRRSAGLVARKVSGASHPERVRVRPSASAGSGTGSTVSDATPRSSRGELDETAVARLPARGGVRARSPRLTSAGGGRGANERSAAGASRKHRRRVLRVELPARVSLGTR